MKKLTKILFALMLFLQLSSLAQCPIQGDSPKQKLQTLDTLKNRTQKSITTTTISIDDIMKPGDDTKRFSQNQYVNITAYVFEVKYGGPETCNCHDKDKSQLDIHIEIVKDLNNASGDKRMIVEINRFTRANDKSMDYALIHSLKGKKVLIEGWLFFDEEHKQNAINTKPEGTNIWRGTCWEIHPCLFLQEVK